LIGTKTHQNGIDPDPKPKGIFLCAIKKPLPALLVVLLDLLGIGAMLGIFALVQLSPRAGSGQPLQSIVSKSTPASADGQSAAPEIGNNAGPRRSAEDKRNTRTNADTCTRRFLRTLPNGRTGGRGGRDRQLCGTATCAWSFPKSARRRDYFVADVWVRNIHGFKPPFAKGKFGHSLYEMPTTSQTA
jgi:hypothetical protein